MTTRRSRTTPEIAPPGDPDTTPVLVDCRLSKGGGDRRMMPLPGLGWPLAWMRSDGAWHHNERTGPTHRRVATYRGMVDALLRDHVICVDHDCEAAQLVRALRAVAPDAIEAEYREAAVALAEAEFAHLRCDEYQHKNCTCAAYGPAYSRYAAAKAARDGAR